MQRYPNSEISEHKFTATCCQRSRDLDFARDHMAEFLRGHSLFLRRPGLRLGFEHRYRRLPGLTVSQLTYGQEVEIEVPPARSSAATQGEDYFLFQVTVGGRCELTASQGNLSLHAGSAFAVLPGMHYSKLWSHDARQLLARVDRVRWLQHLGERERVYRAISTVSNRVNRQPQSPGACNSASLALSLRKAMDRDRTYSDEITTIDVLESLASAFGQSCLDYGIGRLPAWLYLYCRDLIWDLSPSQLLADVARRAGVNERTLQLGVLKMFGLSPVSLRKAIRLERARELLSETDASGRRRRVSDVAIDCGYYHLGRFAGDYRMRFGVSPSLQEIPIQSPLSVAERPFGR